MTGTAFLKSEKVNLIQGNEQKIYQHGYRIMHRRMICYVLLAIIALLLGTPGETAIFILFFIPLRKYAGGFHLSSAYLCMFMSVAVISISGIMVKHMHLVYDRSWGTAVWIIIAVLIVINAPVGCRSKRLDQQEIKVYKERSAYVLAAQFLGVFVLTVFGVHTFLYAAFLAHAVVLFSLLLGKVLLNVK